MLQFLSDKMAVALLLVLMFNLKFGVHPAAAVGAKAKISTMTLREKIAQMGQVEIHLLLDENNKPIDSKLQEYFGEIGIGSVLVTPVEGFTASQYRSLIAQVQKISTKIPVIFGIDSVHGANYIEGAIMTPQQINIASTWNITNAYIAGKLASKDTRAAGMNWIFSPILGLGMESLWSRMYETFGEDPLLVGEMGKAIVKGIQEVGNDSSSSIPSRSAACAKHFVGYSAPRTGHDRSPSWIPRRHLYQYFVRPWRNVLSSSATDNGGATERSEDIALTVMESYTETEGVPMVADAQSLHKLLRQKLGFDGVLVTDYQEIENLVSWHKAAENLSEAVKLALSDGTVDLSMIPWDLNGWVNNVLRSMSIDPTREDSSPRTAERNKFAPYPQYPNRVEIDRIDESVERILNLKEKLNMFSEIVVEDDKLLDEVGTDDDRMVALDIARQSITLVKNNDQTLPIDTKKTNLKIHVTGPTSASIRYQSGGWTIGWQGSTDDQQFSYGTSVLTAAKKVDHWDVSSSCGVDILGQRCTENMYAHLASEADYVIICVGEEAYTEKPGDIRNLELPEGQVNLVKQVKQSMKTDKGKIIVVYFGGRPRLLKTIIEAADAIIMAFLPGPDGGQAVVDILSGKYNPSAKLPLTYPKYADKGGVPYWNAVTDMCTQPDHTNPLPHYQYVKCEVEWPFGHGLSYSQFTYSELKVSATQLVLQRSNQFKSNVKISVNIQNTGDRTGSETIMLFLFVENRQVTPEQKLLFWFDKIELPEGEKKTVETELSLHHLRYIGPYDDTHYVLQPGMKVKVGAGPYVDCRSEINTALCSQSISVVEDSQQKYEASCEAACNLWGQSDCDKLYGLNSEKCWDECIASNSLPEIGTGWGWNYVSCIEPIALDDKIDLELRCSGMTTFCRNVFDVDINGPNNTATNIPSKENSHLTVLVAFLSGMVGSIIILYSTRKRQPSQREIEFTPIDDRSLS